MNKPSLLSNPFAFIHSFKKVDGSGLKIDDNLIIVKRSIEIVVVVCIVIMSGWEKPILSPSRNNNATGFCEAFNDDGID